MKLWIAISLLLLVATACESEPERPTYLTFGDSGFSGAHCDGPCDLTIIDSCWLSLGGGPHFIAKMPMAKRDVELMPNSCDLTPPTYASSYFRVPVQVDVDLYGNLKRGDNVEVLFLSTWISELEWEKDDYLLLSVREDQSEWFVGIALHVELHATDVQALENNDVTPGEVVFDLPSKISDLQSELAVVNQDYAQKCDAPRLSDAEFSSVMRHDHNCDSVGDDADTDSESDAGANNDD